MRPADKGFDHIALRVAQEDASGVALLVTEDKASTRPRATIQREVWPDIKAIERGDRDPELISEVSSMLGFGIADDRAAALIEKIAWRRDLHHRVCVAVESVPSSPARWKALFRGYPTRVRGHQHRRRGDTICLPDLRDWMDDFANLILVALRALEDSE